MLRQLEGKVAVVTGAASGIGAALCRGFAAEGMRVVVADIDDAGETSLAAIRNGDFLVPTKPSYAGQLRNRLDALVERRIPGPVEVD